jgi:hypothetical protein
VDEPCNPGSIGTQKLRVLRCAVCRLPMFFELDAEPSSICSDCEAKRGTANG